jgi:hypothetical protein
MAAPLALGGAVIAAGLDVDEGRLSPSQIGSSDMGAPIRFFVSFVPFVVQASFAPLAAPLTSRL